MAEIKGLTEAFHAADERDVLRALRELSEQRPGPVSDTSIGMRAGMSMHLVTKALARLAGKGEIRQAGTYMWEVAK